MTLQSGSSVGIEDSVMDPFPRVSIVVPTRNSGKTLGRCLDSLKVQSYPREKIELLVIDANSEDLTKEIAWSHNAKVVTNPRVTGEAGKAVGILAATGDMILSVDSDNVIPRSDWLVRMIEPLRDPSIISSEALFYHYDENQPSIIRYCSLIGADDPVSLYLGFYGRYSHLTGRWTDIIPEHSDDRGDYSVVTFTGSRLPTMGANGFLIRAEPIRKLVAGGYLFDVDLPYQLIEQGYTHFARVNVGVLHLFAFNLNDYVKKTYRRIRDFHRYQRLGVRRYGWLKVERKKLLLLIFSVTVGFPLVADSIKGYKRKPDVAWFLNWALCFLSVAIYGIKDLTSGLTLIVGEKR